METIRAREDYDAARYKAFRKAGSAALTLRAVPLPAARGGRAGAGRRRPPPGPGCSSRGHNDERMKQNFGRQSSLGLEQGRPVRLPEAAASWYDTVYKPIAELIRTHGILEQLPGWTEADLVVEITRRWLALSKSGKPSGPQPAVNWLLLDEEARKWGQPRRSIQLPA